MKFFYLIFICCIPRFHLWAYLEIIFVRINRYNSFYSAEGILEKYLDRSGFKTLKLLIYALALFTILIRYMYSCMQLQDLNLALAKPKLTPCDHF